MASVELKSIGIPVSYIEHSETANLIYCTIILLTGIPGTFQTKEIKPPSTQDVVDTKLPHRTLKER